MNIPTHPHEPVLPADNRQRFDNAQAFWKILSQFDGTKLSPYRALRNSLGVILPLISGYALGMPRGGLVVASGALNVSYSDGSQPYRERAKLMLRSSFLCALAVFAGAIAGRHQAGAILLATAWAFVAGMLIALGGAASDLGVISLVTLLIYSAQPLTPREAAISGLLALAGGLLQTALSVALWPVDRYQPERRALGNFFLELANGAEVPVAASSAPPASIHTEQAQDALSGLSRDPDVEGLRYRALLNQGERIRLSLLMLLRLRLRMERERSSFDGVDILNRYLLLVSQILHQLSDSLMGGQNTELNEILDQIEGLTTLLRKVKSEIPASFLAAVAKDALFQMDALNGQLRAAMDLATDAGEPVAPGKPQPTQPIRERFPGFFGGWIEILRGNLNLKSAIFRHAVRLAALVALGDLAGRSVSWQRSYWLPMTIVLVLKPEFSVTFSRGLLRIAGTVVGLLFATALFHFIHPSFAIQAGLIFAFVFLLRWLGPANYGIFTVVVSGLIVLLLAITGVSPKDVIWARGINTVTGGAIALLAYRLWPSWERTRVPDRIAQMLDAYRKYFHALLQSETDESAAIRELERLRRTARAARSNLEASIDRLNSEPGTTREQMNRLNAILASSHRFIHAAMAIDALGAQHSLLSRPAQWKKFSASVETTLILLTAALLSTPPASKDFPDLREEHRLLTKGLSTEEAPGGGGFDTVSIESDRITNSVNTLTEQIMAWIHSPDYRKFHDLQLQS